MNTVTDYCILSTDGELNWQILSLTREATLVKHKDLTKETRHSDRTSSMETLVSQPSLSKSSIEIKIKNLYFIIKIDVFYI